ncbi:MAG: hypothetical protein A2W25_02200 [candidate division Zixibacteria bacterium RBG_16_53_22]|nr:MAG: hypothetical protein A2W25_02200 [candidate division Zixibacteria bacterium RBG_16_53_22]
MEECVGKEKRSPAVFLDRDGVIIVEKNFQADPNDIEFIPGSVEGLLKLNPKYLKVVVSNQSGIARGYFSHDEAVAVNQAVDEKLSLSGIRIDAWYFCPHGPDDGCDCRKPRPGLIMKAADELDLELSASWIIGDKSSDIGAGTAAGIRTILVKTGYAGKEPGADDSKPDFTADNLYCAIDIINKGVGI